jgi:hypothetical protein
MVAVESNRNDLSFEYDYAPVNELAVNTVEDEKTGKPVVDTVEVNGEAHKPSNRFFNSLFARFQFNKAFFKYFDHTEVFERISERGGSDRLRLCVERSVDDKGKSQSRLLAVSNPKKPIVAFDQLLDKLDEYKGQQVTYNNGIVESHHVPRSGNHPFKIGGDAHANRFLMSCPVDGYGSPSVYLALIRMVCTNGMIAMSKAFRSTVSLGTGEDDINYALVRVLDQFASDEGFAALRQRIESAQRSWCSVQESQKLYKLLAKLHGNEEGAILGEGSSLEAAPFVRKSLLKYNEQKGRENADEIGGRVMTSFHGMTGDTTELYGLANLDALSAKRQATLPVNCTVYDAINFATEIATHYAEPGASRQLNAYVGTLLTQEYDMEGTKDRFEDFKDFHMGMKLQSGLTGSN